jgi:hypothetical protein
MYKVTKKSNWTDSKGKVRNFYCFVKANTIEDATKYSAQKWGLDNIKEVIEITKNENIG